MLPIGAVIVDFDGTACLHDVGVDVLDRFGTDASRNRDLAGFGVAAAPLGGEPCPDWREPA